MSEPLLTGKEIKAEISSRSNLYDEPTRAAFLLGAVWGAQTVRKKMESRAQPAQAVPASCGECGKKTSDGWALYCVACMEKAGLPARAVPLLSDDEIALIVADCAASAHRQDDFSFARSIEQAVRAKCGIVGKEGA